MTWSVDSVSLRGKETGEKSIGRAGRSEGLGQEALLLGDGVVGEPGACFVCAAGLLLLTDGDVGLLGLTGLPGGACFVRSCGDVRVRCVPLCETGLSGESSSSNSQRASDDERPRALVVPLLKLSFFSSA